MGKLFIDYFITRKRFILLGAIETVLFFLYFYIVSPSNFGSFSDTLRNYISALGTLLAVVVSFNTLALQNQMKNLPDKTSRVQEQIDNLEDLIKPISEVKESNSAHSDNTFNAYNPADTDTGAKLNDEEKAILFRAKENLTDAVRGMIILVRVLSMQALEDKKKNHKGERDSNSANIYNDIFTECSSRLSLYKRTQHIFSLVTLSTTEFIQKLRFTTDDTEENDHNRKALFESLKRLHVLKSIGYSIFVRNTLADLSKELLISSIPVITFIGLIASISNYENYPITLLRILFAISIAITSIPFILLFIRTMPILHLIKTSSTIPFSRQ
jgi:hypothetical protein